MLFLEAAVALGGACLLRPEAPAKSPLPSPSPLKWRRRLGGRYETLSKASWQQENGGNRGGNGCQQLQKKSLSECALFKFWERHSSCRSIFPCLNMRAFST